MTNKEFYRELGNIDPKMIEAAAPAEKVQKKKKNVWVKWVSIAACFCIMLTASFTILPHLLDRNGDDNAAIVYIFSSYDSNSSKPQPSLIITATVDAYINKNNVNNGVLDVLVGLATKIDYSTMEESHYPDRTILTIETNGLPINNSDVKIEEEHEITDPKYQCNDEVDGVFQDNYPSYHQKYYIDFSSLNSGDSGEIKISFTNYYTEAEDREYEGAILRIYYAVKGDIIAFSRDSVEDAEEKANEKYKALFSFGSFGARDD